MSPADIVEELRRAFRPGLAFLLGQGYTHDATCELVSQGTGYTVVGEYASRPANRVVRLSYLPGRDEAHRPVKPWGLVTTFVAELVPGPDCPFDTGAIDVCHTALWKLEGSPADRLAVHFGEAARVLGERFRAVLTGEAWHPDPFDFDKV